MADLPRPFRLGILTALWRRPEVSAPVLRHYAALAAQDHPPGVPSGIDLTLMAVRSPEDPDPCPPVPGWHYAEAPNAPLSCKWNAGAGALHALPQNGPNGERGLDAVMIVGSDDFVAPGYMAAAADAIRGGATLVRTEAVVFADAATGRAVRCRMARMGAGRVLAASVLDRLNWQPWPPGLGRRLDGAMDKRIRTSGGARQVCIQDAPPVLDVKSPVNLWDYDTVRAWGGSRAEDLSPQALRALLTEHYPEALSIMAQQPKHVGGGWYELPSGEKVQGKDAALAAMREALQAQGLSAPIAPTEPRPGGTHSAQAAASREAKEAKAKAADEAATGTLRLRALKNIPGEVAGQARRVYRGREFDAPAGLVRNLLAKNLAEKV